MILELGHRAVLAILRSDPGLSVQDIIVRVQATGLTGNEVLIALNDLEDWAMIAEKDGKYKMTKYSIKEN